MLLLAAILACSSDDPIAGDRPRRPDRSESRHADTGVEAVPGVDATVTEEDAGEAAVAEDDWIFDQTFIHDVQLWIPEASWAGLFVSPYDFVEATFVYDGLEVPDVGVRLRGKIGSFRDLNGKPKFKVEFNQFVPGQNFYGLDGISLNNEVVDCSYLKEPLAYEIFRLAGAPSLRTSFARVSVNGQHYGLYVVVELPDDAWLKRTFADPSGNYYDGKYVWYGGYNYQLIDFTPSQQDYFQLEEGEDVGHADIHAITDAVQANAGTGHYVAGTEGVIDWPRLHRYLAVEQWVGHDDGYALNTNNYRVYFDPETGKANWTPWDFDYGFLNDSDWGMNWWYPAGDVAYYCFQDPACVAAHQPAVADLVAALDAEALAAQLTAWDALTYPDAQSDPRRECDVSYVSYYRTYLQTWVAGRNAYMESFWGL